jgi:hypothetical protein
MNRKLVNLAAIFVLMASGSALALQSPTGTSISKCQSGKQVCYCSHGCTAGGGTCECEIDL